MTRLRPFLTELCQQAMGGWRRERRSSPELRSAERASARAARSQSSGIAAFGVYHGHAGSGGAGPSASFGESFACAARAAREVRVFDVIGGDTGRRYRIKNGFQLGLLDNKGRTRAVLCFIPEGELPAGDVMLAQKLALELFESDTLKIANKFSVNHHWA